MRKLYCIVSVMIMLSSCKKSSNTATVPPDQTISFKINGVFREYKGVENFICYNYGINAPYFKVKMIYGFSAGTGPSTDSEGISFYAISSTVSKLSIGDYFIQSPMQVALAGGGVGRMFIATYSKVKQIGINPDIFDTKSYRDEIGDFSRVKITSISDDYVSGTFSCSVTREGGTEKLSITEGNFTNFKMK